MSKPLEAEKPLVPHKEYLTGEPVTLWGWEVALSGRRYDEPGMVMRDKH